jgi:hypothetical protein
LSLAEGKETRGAAGKGGNGIMRWRLLAAYKRVPCAVNADNEHTQGGGGRIA